MGQLPASREWIHWLACRHPSATQPLLLAWVPLPSRRSYHCSGVHKVRAIDLATANLKQTLSPRRFTIFLTRGRLGCEQTSAACQDSTGANLRSCFCAHYAL